MQTQISENSFTSDSFIVLVGCCIYAYETVKHLEQLFKVYVYYKLLSTNVNHPLHKLLKVFNSIKDRQTICPFHQMSVTETHFIRIFITFFTEYDGVLLCINIIFLKAFGFFLNNATTCAFKYSMYIQDVNTIWDMLVTHQFTNYKPTLKHYTTSC